MTSHLIGEAPTREALAAQYTCVRRHSVALATPLSAEDQCVQSMPEASPAKWHLAHTTWFFETLVLKPHLAGYRPHDERFFYLFNSYYESLGARHPRPLRGLLTRPSRDEVLAYRAHVDEAMLALFSQADEGLWHVVQPILTLGLHHEQQHQELLLTDILHAFSCNPLLPAYGPLPQGTGGSSSASGAGTSESLWRRHQGGIVAVGHAGKSFAFDNETPRHEVLLSPHEVARDLVTCGDYLRFIEDGGYRRPELWLSDGWAAVQAQGWQAPAYWLAADDPRLAHGGAPAGAAWCVFGLQGVQPIDPSHPVSQLSFFEASAYAEWAGARLPTEFEWETAAASGQLRQATGQVWQWTRSSYDPYPGFRPLPGPASEYNGKFMVGQLVLRGASLATPPGHARLSYRNFFWPAARWQFSGIRLARDL
ncbi:MAG: ergothioneine biosynthesis protein EgtB [Rubrivivax sp.]|nr:MAG: ergothioneine biosynthesis protein EgtB [Rubrivivax sp.]